MRNGDLSPSSRMRAREKPRFNGLGFLAIGVMVAFSMVAFSNHQPQRLARSKYLVKASNGPFGRQDLEKMRTLSSLILNFGNIYDISKQNR